MTKVVIIGAILTAILMLIFTKIDPNISSNQGQSSSTTQVSKDYVTCTISGEVNRPGSYVLNSDSTLLDLISNAGGLTANADDLAFNSSIFLIDGMDYYIAKKTKTPDTCEIETIDKVNINTASKEELMQVNGIGASIADAIINYREQYGEFTYLEELKNVSGIGNATFEKIKDYVVIY
ncbi:MAG: helix-hairpin-helix domain-containing protein [Erysipelotrichales bacterium]|nr:helix-hairpin-helix domain-containing protein [Erysipelotrichales bacterium]